MEQTSYLSNVLAFAIVASCWIIFAAALLYRGGSSAGHRSREPLSWIGLFMQLISYPISWMVWRSPVFSPFVDDRQGLSIVFQIFAIGTALFSAWLAVAAIRELGEQWSLQARVLEDHKLITSGVYGLVRHPIYTAMLGMLIATGIVVSHWLALAAAIVVFLAGTKIRIHLEEKLLAEAFGEQFQKWKSQAPQLLPSVSSIKRFIG